MEGVQQSKSSDITEDYYQAQLVVSALDLAVQVILPTNYLNRTENFWFGFPLGNPNPSPCF